MLRLPQLDPSRKCGPCTACCTVMEVKELGKAPNQSCKHACNGCAIYPTRPNSCRIYRCAWQLGFGLPDDRPDKIGVVFTFVNDKAVPPRVMDICELWEGAVNESRPSALIQRIGTNQNVYIFRTQTKRF
jgi:hypothetical protein